MIFPITFVILAPKSFGAWSNEGKCTATGDDPECGPGTQIQKRACTDGTVAKCTDSDRQRSVTCAVAGTQLPACKGKQNRNIYVYIYIYRNI